MKKRGVAYAVVSIVIAVIGILIFFGVAAKLGLFLTGGSDTEKQEFLDSVMGKINLMDDGQSNVFIFTGIEDNYLAGWSKNEAEKPSKCFGSCLCVCDRSNACEAGICEDIDKDNVYVGADLIVEKLVQTPLIVQKTVGFENTGPIGNIYLEDALMEINISKSDDSITILLVGEGPHRTTQIVEDE